MISWGQFSSGQVSEEDHFHPCDLRDNGCLASFHESLLYNLVVKIQKFHLILGTKLLRNDMSRKNAFNVRRIWKNMETVMSLKFLQHI